MRSWLLSAVVLAVSWSCSTVHGQAEEGAQFLDGIGETALIARYLFDGNCEDWSRNSYHAALHGTAAYVDDELFGRVLSLPGGLAGAYVQMPGRTLVDTDTLSVVGWLKVKDLTRWQRFFDLGRDTGRNFFCTPVGEERDSGCRARITTRGWTQEQGPTAFRLRTGQWVHLGVVLDATGKTLSLYVDGVRVGRSTGVDLSLADVLDQDDPSANRLYIGKSRYKDAALGARLHDVRFYSIALSDRQVMTIRHNALSEDAMTVTEGSQQEGDLEKVTEPASMYANLTAVPDITVETFVGHLPRLPVHIAGLYSDNADGPLVRVIWPAPTDNSQVQQAGAYVITGAVPGTAFAPKATITVRATPDRASRPHMNLATFPLGQVVLNRDDHGRDTPFIKNRDKFILTLAQTDPNSFLYNFRDAFGQPQPEGVRPLRGWDSQTTRLRGHASGHYLTAIAQAYAGTTYDKALQANFAAKMNTMIDVLHDLSQKSGKPATEGGSCNADPTAVPPGPGKSGYDSDLSEEGIRTDYWNWGAGFVSGYPPDQFIMLEKGATYGGRNNQIWAPYYTLHKILAGLMDCYEVGGNPKALEIARDMGLWVYERLSVLPTETRIKMWNRYIAGEYGGMNEAMARLHQLTGDARFLTCARLFDNIDLFFGNADHEHGLACNVDTLRGKHANQHIPQITGALGTYRGAQDPAYYRIAENFWHICTHGYMYSIGGVAGAKNPNNAECFTAQPDSLFAHGFSEGGQNETCATYNLLKLSRQLFLFDQDAKFMDYYEQALYNHILASVDEDNPGNTYHVPLNPGARKRFGNARMDGFTCCNGTALESSTKLQDSIYFRSKDNKTLCVNLYIPSTLNWPQHGVTLRQRTSFPYADTTKLTLTGSGSFAIRVRVPRWATNGFDVTINGKVQEVDTVPGTYLTLSRSWRDGDTIELRMPFGFYLRPVMDRPNIASLFYGPVLLAVEEPEPRTSWRKVTLNAADLSQSIEGDPSTLRFSTNGVNLKPFYETYSRHSVYLDVTLE